ncbi:MAG: 50S ribosomal protein L18 [Ardenticatenaceae bacterium]
MSQRQKRKSTRASRLRRHARVRRKIIGTEARPRLNVFRSATNIYAQVINDETGHTLVAANSLQIRDLDLNKTEAARRVGMMVAERARDAGLTSVVFDRGGYRYHGRVKALAEAARSGGLKF